MRIPYLSSMQVVLRRTLILVFLAALGLLFFTTTATFQSQAKARVLQALEEATGARISVSDFHASIWTRQIVMRGVVARSHREKDKPFLTAESILVQLRFSTLFIAERELRLLRVQKPRVEVTFDKDGNTNLPLPGLIKPDPRQSPLDPLFKLAIRRFEIVDGVYVWDDQPHKLDLALERAAASLAYDPARDRYTGSVAAHGTEKAWNSAAKFTLGRRELQVNEFIFELGRSSAKGSITVRDFRTPAVQASYTGSIDVAQAGALLHLEALHAGTLTAKGNANYDAKAGLRASGEARLERATLLAFRDLTANAKFESTPDAITFKPLHAALLGGAADGSLHITDLTRAPHFVVEANVAGLSFTALAATLKEMYPNVPLERAPLVTIIDGATEISFGGAEGVEVALRGALRDPGAVPPGYVPVHGRTDLRLIVAGERLILRDTVLDTPSSHLEAEGDGRFRVTLQSRNQKEFEWLSKLPFTVRSAQLDGTLSGPLRSMQYEGRAGVDGMVLPIGGRDFAFDHFDGGLTVSETHLEVRDGRLFRGMSSILFNAGASLARGEIPQDSPIAASAELRQWDAPELLRWLKLDYPVTGAVRAALTCGGTLRAPSVRGSIEVTSGAAWNERFDSAAANIAWAGHRIEANNVRIARGRGRVTGMVSYQDDTHAYRFQAAIAGTPLEDFPRLQFEKFTVAGNAEGQASGSGVWDDQRIAPTGHAAFALHNVRLNNEAFSDLTITADADGDKAVWTLSAGRAPAKFAASGDVALREPYVFQSKVETSQMDLDSFLQPYLGEHITAHSHFEGDARFTGDLRHFADLAGKVEIRKLDVGLYGLDVRNDGVWRASYANHSVKLDPLKIAGPSTSLVVQGSVDMPPVPAASRGVSLRADGEVNLKLIETLQPGLNSSGVAKLKMSMDGVWENPQLNGRADIEEGQIGSETFPTSLSHLNGALLFNKTGMRIERLTGESGGGRLNLTGVLDYTRSPRTFQVRAQATGVRMRYPPGVSTVLDADLSVVSTPARSQMTGDITVQRAGVNANFDLGEALAQVKQASTAPSELSWARTLQLYVRVVSSNEIRFESGSRASLDAQFDLRVHGTLADPALIGKMTILDGKVNFLKTDYIINRGEIQFVNPFRIDPIISMDVSTRKQQYDISLDFSGPLDKLRVNYRSDPPLPVPDIQLLLLLGRSPTGGSSAAYDPARASIGSTSILSDTTTATVNNRIGKLFGGLPVSVDPQATGIEANPAARVSLVQEVARNVTLTSSTSLANAQQVIIQLEWNVNRRFSILATRDQNGLFGVDFKWRKQVR